MVLRGYPFGFALLALLMFSLHNKGGISPPWMLLCSSSPMTPNLFCFLSNWIILNQNPPPFSTLIGKTIKATIRTQWLIPDLRLFLLIYFLPIIVSLNSFNFHQLYDLMSFINCTVTKDIIKHCAEEQHKTTINLLSKFLHFLFFFSILKQRHRLCHL